MSKGPQPTPISVILQLYQKPNQPPLIIGKIDEIPIKTQIQLLDPDKCNVSNHRNEIIRQFNNEDLRRNAFKRIRFKSMLNVYYKHWHQIREPHFKMIENWNERDFALNVIVHFIKHCDDGKLATESEDKQLKRLGTTWRFLNYLTQFFDKKGFNGKEFIHNHVANKQENGDKQKATGFGLTIVKEVCKQFDQKTGQYTKVKKQLSSWAKKNVERYETESTFSLDDIKENPVADVGNKVGNQGQNVNVNDGGNNDINEGGNKIVNKGGALAKGQGEKWFWFCDEGGIKWVPYQDQHQVVIEDAWVNNKANVIVMTRFKIDFHRENPGIASGQQYNYQIHNSWRRGVIRGMPDGKNMINDIPCDAQPKY